MLRRTRLLLVALTLSACATPKGSIADAPTPGAASPPGASVANPAATYPATPPVAAAVKLEAAACAHRGFGCGSCAIEGVWGALWIGDDCSLECKKWCGNQPANAPPAIALPALVSGPNTVELKVTLPPELVTPRKTDQIKKKKAGAPASAESVSIIERSSAFTYFATHDSVSCGLLGPATAAISCNPPQVAYCACEASGIWGKASCECRQGPTVRTTAVNNCHVDPHPGTSCPAAGVIDVVDPGCATSCAAGFTGVCKESSCTGNAWMQGICACLPQ